MPISPLFHTRDEHGKPAIQNKVSAAKAEDLDVSSITDPESPSEKDAFAESLDLLEWPQLCRQVAAFCGTVRGYEVARSGALPLGRNLAHTLELQRQTAEALAIGPFDLEGCYEIRPALQAAEEGRVLTPLQLNGVARSLECAARIVRQVLDVGAAAAALGRLADSIGDCGSELTLDIRRCIDPQAGTVLDRVSSRGCLLAVPALVLTDVRFCQASEALAEARLARRANLADLRARMERYARELHQKGAADRPQVVSRRDRMCVAVKVGRQSELPKGSVLLDQSSTGATVFMEPADLTVGGSRVPESSPYHCPRSHLLGCACMTVHTWGADTSLPFPSVQPLANAEAKLWAKEEEEEQAVL